MEKAAFLWILLGLAATGWYLFECVKNPIFYTTHVPYFYDFPYVFLISFSYELSLRSTGSNIFWTWVYISIFRPHKYIIGSLFTVQNFWEDESYFQKLYLDFLLPQLLIIFLCRTKFKMFILNNRFLKYITYCGSYLGNIFIVERLKRGILFRNNQIQPLISREYDFIAAILLMGIGAHFMNIIQNLMRGGAKLAKGQLKPLKFAVCNWVAMGAAYILIDIYFDHLIQFVPAELRVYKCFHSKQLLMPLAGAIVNIGFAMILSGFPSSNFTLTLKPKPTTTTTTTATADVQKVAPTPKPATPKESKPANKNNTQNDKDKKNQ